MEPLTPDKCTKCSGDTEEWYCYCTWGCEGCGLNRKCRKCGYVFKVYTPEQLEEKKKQRLISQAASKAGHEARLRRQGKR